MTGMSSLSALETPHDPLASITANVAENVGTGEFGFDRILVLDFGSQYSHLIVRRLRDMGVFSELRCFDISAQDIIAYKPRGVILSGGPCSVYEEDSPHCSDKFWEYVEQNSVPVLGICYGMQEMSYHYGGVVTPGTNREFGEATIELILPNSQNDNCHSSSVDYTLPSHILFSDSRKMRLSVWMSHGDKVTEPPAGFEIVAKTNSCPVASFCDPKRRFYGVQFHPEVTHTEDGLETIRSFVFTVCSIHPSWNMSRFATVGVDILKSCINSSAVIGAVSGGVDSTVAAALMQRAVGNQFEAIFVDTGLLRKNEGDEVSLRLRKHIPGLRLTCVNASAKFFAALKGVIDPEEKRKVVGKMFIETFEDTIRNTLNLDPQKCFFLQGTLYPDVIESVSMYADKGAKGSPTPTSKAAITIKTHHNVGGLPEKMKMQVIEPLRELFKDEVRKLGEELGIPSDSLWRHPFPGPGLAIRIIGSVTRERVDALKEADDIFIYELKNRKLYDKIAQAFVLLLPEAKSVGVMGDFRTYEWTAVLRAVQTTDFMTADWFRIPYDVVSTVSSRIINEVKGINRVCMDVSSKPPATIEWE